MTIKERLEDFEYTYLSDFAQKSKETKGRLRKIEDCPLRTNFQRDRDRIIHSKSFRRLKHKTQVFLAPFDDHFRTRLTHTLEVSQIARTLARALRLNEDLTEAIALGHDLGHTPFGHCGEGVLNEITGHFAHNEQSVRVVEKLEDLNLCRETVQGIYTHSWGLENCGISVITAFEDLPKECREYFTSVQSKRLNKMITEIIKNSIEKPVVSMSEEGWAYTNILRDWMFKNVYTDSPAKLEEKKAKNIIKSLFEYYSEKLKDYCVEDKIQRAVTDYIASMTDSYAIEKYKDIFIPKPLAMPQRDENLIKLANMI